MNWREEKLQEVGRGERVGTGERRTYWNWREEKLQELGVGEKK